MNDKLTAEAAFREVTDRVKREQPDYANTGAKSADYFRQVFDRDLSQLDLYSPMRFMECVGTVRKEGTFAQKQDPAFWVAEEAVKVFLQEKMKALRIYANRANMMDVVTEELRKIDPDRPDQKRAAGV